jgi:hypothetical protein
MLVVLRMVPYMKKCVCIEYGVQLELTAVCCLKDGGSVCVLVGTNPRHTTSQKNEGLSYPYADA